MRIATVSRHASFTGEGNSLVSLRLSAVQSWLPGKRCRSGRAFRAVAIQGSTAIKPFPALRHARHRLPSIVIALLLPLSWCASASEDATNAEAQGLAVARAADSVDVGFADSTADLTMVMQASSDSPIRREMRQLTLEVENDGDKSILVFDRPRDLKGTAILTHTHRAGPDDQWLYLPALKRVKRISAADKSGPFMGSEFAYEDLASQEVEKYTYRYLREESLAGTLCDVIERVPVDPKSGYTRQIAWYDQAEHRLQQVEYYDRKNTLLKTMNVVNYQLYLDRFWRPDELQMRNHQTGKQTALVFRNYRLQVGLKPSDFNRNALSRMR